MNGFKKFATFIFITAFSSICFADNTSSSHTVPVDKSFEIKVDLHPGKNKIRIETSDFVICSFYDNAGNLARVDTKRKVCEATTELTFKSSLKVIIRNISNDDVEIKVSKE